MFNLLNKHCLTLLSATFLCAGMNYAVVDRASAQVIKSSTTVSGAITKIDMTHSSSLDLPGMKLLLETPEGAKLKIHLGAEWVLLNQRLGLEEGDNITVTGSVIKTGEEALLIAKSIKKGHKKIILIEKRAE